MSPWKPGSIYRDCVRTQREKGFCVVPPHPPRPPRIYYCLISLLEFCGPVLAGWRARLASEASDKAAEPGRCRSRTGGLRAGRAGHGLLLHFFHKLQFVSSLSLEILSRRALCKLCVVVPGVDTEFTGSRFGAARRSRVMEDAGEFEI